MVWMRGLTGERESPTNAQWLKRVSLLRSGRGRLLERQCRRRALKTRLHFWAAWEATATSLSRTSNVALAAPGTKRERKPHFTTCSRQVAAFIPKERKDEP